MTTNTTTLECIAKEGMVAPTTLNGLPGMSSLEIVEITGKNHKHVLRDIAKMLEELGEWIGPNLDRLKFVQTQYRDGLGRFQPMTILDKELTFTLLSRYSFKLSNLIVKRWLELEGSGFTRVSVQVSVAHLVEREKDNRRAALKTLRKAAKRPLGPAEKEQEKWLRQAKAHEKANPIR